MSDKPEKIDHATFREQIAAALAGGLSAGEMAAFEAHAGACAACADELRRSREAEERMTALFAGAVPVPGMEDRVIHRLRLGHSRRNWLPAMKLHIHPAVGKAVAGVAAAIVLAGMGYSVTKIIDEEQQSQMRVAAGVPVAPSSNAESDSYVGATTQPLSRTRFTDGKNLSYGFQNPYFGRQFNSTLSGEHAVAADVNSGAGDRTGKSALWFEDAIPTHGANASFGVRGASQAGKTIPWVARFDNSSKSANDLGINKSGNGTLVLNGANKFGGSTYWDFEHREGAEKPTDAAGAAPAGAQKATRDYFKQWGDASKSTGKDDWFKPADLGRKLNETAPGDKPVELRQEFAAVHEKPVQQGQQGQSYVLADLDADAKKPASESSAPPPPVNAPPPPNPQQPAEPPAHAPPADQRKIIRNGQMEFEVDRFDAAFAQVTNLTKENGGYVGTTDSEKLPNGKVKGTVTVRVPLDRLDTLVLQLRGIGDLKSQKLEAQDVSKHYSDMDSELRAARAMEERLLNIVKEGKGQIKDLLAAEKELGNWRTKIEQLVGEMKYYDNLVSLSTLNITLYERDIRTPATAYETEQIDTGVEADDVEKARAAALKAIEDAKGRVIQSDLKRYDAGQFGATIVADVPADAAGAMLDRLKQIGKMARLDVQRKQTAAENSATVGPLKVQKRDTRLNLSIYNLANVAPRQTVTLNIAADDVEAAYRTILARVTKAGGRVVTSNLARNKPEATTATVSFEISAAEADAVQIDVRTAGEVMKLAVSENPDVQNVTTAKRGFNIALASSAVVPPRETATMQVAAASVEEARNKILAAASAGKANVLQSQFNQNDQQNANATLELDVKRGEPLAAVEKAIADAGQTVSRVVNRSNDTENTLDSKVRLQLTLGPAEKLPPREFTRMSVELSDVDAAMGDLQATAMQVGGRTVESNLSKDVKGKTQAHVVVEVPLDKAGEIIGRAKGLGIVREIESGKNLQVPAGALARARIDVTFGNGEALVGPDKGIWASIRAGLATSIEGLAISIRFIVVGLCFVLPWALILYVGWRAIKRRRTTSPAAA